MPSRATLHSPDSCFRSVDTLTLSTCASNDGKYVLPAAMQLPQLALRAEVMIRMEQHLKAQGCTQAKAARRLAITQPRVSRLMKGQWKDFSLDMLLTLAARAGLEPTLRLAA